MNKCVRFYDGTFDQEDFDKEVLASKDQDGLMSKEDKAKLDELTGGESSNITTIEAANVVEDADHMFATESQLAKVDAIPADPKYTDTIYEHPETHPATMIIEDETHRFVTDEEKVAWIKRSEMAVANGVPTLDENGLIPSAQLPGFVDDIIEEDNVSKFPTTGESGKLYVDTTTNKTYRWSGTQYVSIKSDGLALGETSATAYAGDKGKANANAISAIVNGTTVVPKAGDANTVRGFTVEANVPTDAVFTDTVYEHPETHPASMIVESSVKKFATEGQLAKVDAIPADPKYTDTIYEHPETHPATMIVEDDTHKFATPEQLTKLDEIPKFVNTPYYDETSKALFGCGVAITIDTTDTDGILKCTYVREGTKSFTFPAGGNIYGGGNGKDDPCFYPATCVTINGGALHSVCGGNLKAGNVGSATITINGGSFSSGIVGGGLSSADRKEYDNIVGHVEIIVNNTDGNALTVSGGPQGLGIVGDVRFTINGGDIKWATAGGNNGYTGYGEVIVNGGTMTVLQGCNRGSMGNIKITINGGTIQRVYAGGETEDDTVTATYKRSEIHVNGGTIGAISAGTNGGVEDATNVSGTYVEGVITDEAATAMNLIKSPIKFTDIAIEGTMLVFKNGDVTVKSLDLSTINA